MRRKVLLGFENFRNYQTLLLILKIYIMADSKIRLYKGEANDNNVVIEGPHTYDEAKFLGYADCQIKEKFPWIEIPSETSWPIR